jgi:hypothetical protein
VDSHHASLIPHAPDGVPVACGAGRRHTVRFC